MYPVPMIVYLHIYIVYVLSVDPLMPDVYVRVYYICICMYSVVYMRYFTHKWSFCRESNNLGHEHNKPYS